MKYLESAIKLLSKAEFVFAWHCPSPPDVKNWQETTNEDLDNYATMIDYLEEYAEEISPVELFNAVGGEQRVLNDLWAGSIYDEYMKIEDDWSVSWFKSKYPDGTPVYFHTHSGIEHVYEPSGYNRPDPDSTLGI